jgi:hypothetical protein
MAEEGFVTRVRVPNTPWFYRDDQRWVPEALADAWREHVTADTFGVDYRGRR